MNARIKEITEQVEKYISTTNFEGMSEDEMTYEEIFNKKFAELIINDCINALQNNKANLTIDSYSDAIWEIKDHFGVN